MRSFDINSFTLPKIDLQQYDYQLPSERIASYPVDNRSSSKLLVANASSEKIYHENFNNITEYIPANSLIAVNETKVISARLKAQKPTGGQAEILVISPVDGRDPQIALNDKCNTCWNCIIGGRNIRNNMELTHPSGIGYIATIIEKQGNTAKIEFMYDNRTTFAEIIDYYGLTPLPPYIKREAKAEDKKRYQTVYAVNEGSVAAPTAGLHFSKELFDDLYKEKNIDIAKLTLHVGPGTFKPIESDIQSHNMHIEQVIVSINTIKKLCDHFQNHSDKTLIATGTTSLRTLETLYWIGASSIINKTVTIDDALTQNAPYYYASKHSLPTSEEAFNRLLTILDMYNEDYLRCNTQLFIVPGYEFHTADALITNFHMPKSTLILLVAAFVGTKMWRKIYNEALTNDYRFLSYGDSSILFR